MQYQGEEVDVIRLLIRQFYSELDGPLLHGEEGELCIKFRVKRTEYGENDRTGELVCTHELKVLEVELKE